MQNVESSSIAMWSDVGVALFRRRKQAPAQPAPGLPLDETFPFFDVDQGLRFRSTVRQAFAEAGREVEVYADVIVDAGGAQFGLGNLAAACHNEDGGERAWPDLIRRHVLTITTRIDGPSAFDTTSARDVLARTYPRLMAEQTAGLHLASYRRPVADGIVEVLNLDLPDSVAMFNDENVERFGGLDVLRSHALANLRNVRFEHAQPLEHDGGRIHVLGGESMFVASTMLILPEVVARVEPPSDPANGILVSVPFRHQLNVHVPRDATVVPSLQLLAHFTKRGYDDAVGPLSPHVYWWRPHRIERLTEYADDGSARIVVEDEFGELLQRIVG
jgi:hypothetical protein